MVGSGIELYYTPASPHCRSVLMCIKALELEVDLCKLDMYQKYEHRQPWFLKMNPQHTVPTLNDNGFILWESRAIICYLVNKYGASNPAKRSLYPEDPVIRAKVDRALYFDIGTLYKNIVDYFHPIIISGQEGNERKENALKTSLDYLNDILDKSVYLAGDQLTVADFSVLASVTQLEGINYKIHGYKNLSAYVERLKKELPYYDECSNLGIEMFRTWVENKRMRATAMLDKFYKKI